MTWTQIGIASKAYGRVLIARDDHLRWPGTMFPPDSILQLELQRAKPLPRLLNWRRKPRLADACAELESELAQLDQAVGDVSAESTARLLAKTALETGRWVYFEHSMIMSMPDSPPLHVNCRCKIG